MTMTYQEAINLGGMRSDEYQPFVEHLTEIITIGGEIFTASALSSMTMSAKTLGNFELLICTNGDFELNNWDINNPQTVSGQLKTIDTVIEAVNLLTPHLDDMRANTTIKAVSP